MQDISLNFQADTLFTVTDKIKASVEGRIGWGDTFGVTLGGGNTKHLIVWTPKESSESQVLPGFDSKDGKLTLKIKHRPGAWVSWIDESIIQAAAIDDYDRVQKSVQELERNIRQITDFADGVIANITVQHLGKSLTLSQLAEEVLQSRLMVPNTIKTGGFILTDTTNSSQQVAKVIIPEQTHINRVNLNEDAVLSEIDKNGDNTVYVFIRTHIKNFPDLTDLEYSLALKKRIMEQDNSEKESSVRILPTAAVYHPLESEYVKLVPIEIVGNTNTIEEAINVCSEKIGKYREKVNQHAYQLMTQFQQGVDSRLKALMLNRGQRIHHKVWDDLIVRELRNTNLAFCDYFNTYINEHFDEEISTKTTNQLKEKIDTIIDLWQMQEDQQFTFNNMIQSSYILTNQVMDQAFALFYDLVFDIYFIETGLVRRVQLQITENDVLLDKIHLPEWTSGTVQKKITRIGLRSILHPMQIERMRNVWLTCLEIANYASLHNQVFEQVIHPLETILIAQKSMASQRSNNAKRQTTTKFAGFEIAEKEFVNILNRVEEHLPIIKSWIEHAPKESDTIQEYYTTLWALVLNGKTRERLLNGFQPTCDINISVPDQTKRLINLTLESQLIIEDERDRKTLERNLNKALVKKTGHSLRDITSADKLAIHGDVTLSLLREELERYDVTLSKRASRVTNTTRKDKKRNSVKVKNNGNPNSDSIQAVQTKVSDMIAFLKPYDETESISTLAHAGLRKNGDTIEEIRKQQVLSFDLNELPSIGDTWLNDIKTVNDYPNLRVFLLQNKLPISTTGRILMELRSILSDSLFNQVLGLIQEVRELQNSNYQGTALDQFVDYISEKVWRWELTQITPEELPVVVKEKVLASTVCYEKEVEALMEYAERYDELLESKLKPNSDMCKQRENLESRFQEIVDTLL